MRYKSSHSSPARVGLGAMPVMVTVVGWISQINFFPLVSCWRSEKVAIFKGVDKKKVSQALSHTTVMARRREFGSDAWGMDSPRGRFQELA